MPFDFSAEWPRGLSYPQFLDKFASPDQRRRWDQSLADFSLSSVQKELLASFQRDMQVLVVAGAWCGDCIQQCPIFEHFSNATERLQIRYFDRDQSPQLAAELSVCGAARVPAVMFLAEDGAPCGRYGDKTLAKYRQITSEYSGAACPTGLVSPAASLQAAVLQEWLDQFERIQLILRTSSRLRQKHGD